ncbi:MAG: sarcosine oxidase subunit alpha family protein [Pseudomonadota bacterium]
MTGSNRIAGYGEVSRSKPVTFTFDGKTYQGFEGDTLASALLANGVHLVGRSFKYHRPRGFLSAGPEEPNALVGISRDKTRSQPNVRATIQELYDGLIAESQNRWPSLTFDVGAVNDRFSRLFPAGFYYKTFMWPRSAWDKLYEPFIRRAAGLGHSPTEADPDRYSNRYAHCDLLIVGGGLSGLTAASEAAKSGKSVILCDENPVLGTGLRSDLRTKFSGKSARVHLNKLIETVRSAENIQVLTRTTAFSYLAQNMVALAERVTEHQASPESDAPRERLWQVRAQKVILATGAIERHMVFDGNDKPGVMLANAAQTFLARYGVAVGAKVGVYTATDTAYAAAIALHQAGIQVPVIVDARSGTLSAIGEEARLLGIKVVNNAFIKRVNGRLRVQSMVVEHQGTRETFDVDAIITSAGWTPSLHLFSQSRGKVAWDQETRRFLPGDYAQECQSIGACNGTDTIAELISEAVSAARWGIGSRARAKPKIPEIEDEVPASGGMIGADKGAGPDNPVKAFVDFQNDVTAKDIRLAVKEGFHSIEHVKRYTTTGMATDQGKTSNLHGLAIAAEALGKDIPEVGLTTFRAPYTPVSFGTFVNHNKGELFDPTRKTSIHDWAVEQGAAFEPVSLWQRAWYFPQDGEDMHAAVARECKTTRKIAGIFDASTLGKIEVVGPDAAEFMNRLYTNSWTKLGVGRLKYGIMCREDGFIYDDGVVGRLGENRFHVTTTTGGAPRVLNHMEDYLQTEFPDLKVWLTSTSEQWAVIAVNGPKAREIIAPLVEDIDFSPDALPHMSVREGKICGVPTRLFRMSFTGEMGFEINVPSNYGRAVWDAIWDRGAPIGMVPYGTETMHVLRAEKGYIIVGQDTDGTVTPHDAGLSWAIAKSKPDFVGKRGLERPDLKADGRPQLVGLKSLDGKTVLEEGAQITNRMNPSGPVDIQGFVTSSYWSETLQSPVAMALVNGGRSKMGETLFVPMVNETHKVEVCDTVFLDKEGGRVHG